MRQAWIGLCATFGANANPAGDYMIGLHTLPPESLSYETAGITYVLDKSAVALVVNGVSMFNLAESFTANSAGFYIIGTHTLRPGDASYTIDGTIYILDPSANALIVNGVFTFDISTQQTTHDMPLSLTLNGATATLNSAGQYVVEGQTLTPGGPAITLSGTRISLASDTTALVIGSSTSFLAKPTGVGDLVWAGIAGVASNVRASQLAVATTTASDGRVFTYLPSSGAAASDESGGPQMTSLGSTGATLPSGQGSGDGSSSESQGSAKARPSITASVLIGVVGLVILAAL